ncbi:DUF6090 family protein [Marinicella litoralis]|uniref:Uncharacterized protein n=1 Tax=Marinicella litoralis TaxID=644220 RepID=A0A4R6XT88_9GAMM|nr:DUF6090 family protein [Marinicella litoralis]TDR23165.1 hypothetical protein C8D91_0023 [Marinicella litoralis]
MILRSVTKHVREQNWFAVFLDFMIVVIGVFIGIQVSNWNVERAGEKQAQVLIERLNEDLENDLEVLVSTLDYQAVVRTYAVRAVDGFNGVPTVNDEQFVIAAYQTSQINTPWSYRSTYNEVLSTGQINLIKNNALKSKILAYYSDDFAQQSLITKIAPFREYIRGRIPFQIQDAIRRECGDIVIPVAQTFGAALPANCDLDLPDELFTETASLLRAQPQMLFDLQFQIAVYETQVSNILNFKIETEKLMSAIKEHQP